MHCIVCRFCMVTLKRRYVHMHFTTPSGSDMVFCLNVGIGSNTLLMWPFILCVQSWWNPHISFTRSVKWSTYIFTEQIYLFCLINLGQFILQFCIFHMYTFSCCCFMCCQVCYCLSVFVQPSLENKPYGIWASNSIAVPEDTNILIILT